MYNIKKNMSNIASLMVNQPFPYIYEHQETILEASKAMSRQECWKLELFEELKCTKAEVLDKIDNILVKEAKEQKRITIAKAALTQATVDLHKVIKKNK